MSMVRIAAAFNVVVFRPCRHNAEARMNRGDRLRRVRAVAAVRHALLFCAFGIGIDIRADRVVDDGGDCGGWRAGS